MPRQRLEETTQRAIVAWIELCVPYAIPIAIPNGARRTFAGRATNGVPGLRKGAPDLVVALPGGKVLWLEVKAPSGRVSADQIALHGKLNARGHTVAVVRSIDDVRRAFHVLGVETREAE
jgi:hypothetical protein